MGGANGCLSIINRERLHQQGGEPRTSSPAKAIENQEALKTCALVSLPPNSIQGKASDFLDSGVIATGSIFFVCDELLGMDKLVETSSIIIGSRSINAAMDRHMLASTCLTEEGAEGVISSSNGLVT